MGLASVVGLAMVARAESEHYVRSSRPRALGHDEGVPSTDSSSTSPTDATSPGASSATPYPRRSPVPDGHHRRHLRFAATDRVACGALEDDVHHVRVVVEHDGEQVVAISGEDVRLPWTTCSASLAGLQTLVGTRLADARDLQDAYDASVHCTHLFDVAQLTIARAARGAGTREYRCTVELPDAGADPSTDPTTDLTAPVVATITCDGEVVHRWEVRDGTVVSPGPFAGAALRRGFRERQRALADDPAEAALVLRRAVWMSPIRTMDLDGYESIGGTGVSSGSCFTTQPERIAVAFRNRGSQYDYGITPEALLEDFDEWAARTLSA
jgi:hypothetical protein